MKQLECRIVILYRTDRRIDLGMFDPLNMRYEPLGTHGPDRKEIDNAVCGLRDRIIREGMRVSFCERKK